MTAFNIEISGATAEALADELERIAPMLRDGFTSGAVAGTGWWTTSDIEPEPDPVDDLIEKLEGGDIGEVEFTELALAAGMTMERISTELAKAREEF